MDCCVGFYSKDGGCFGCAPGTFMASVNGTCEACAPGQVQHKSGQSQCYKCAPGQYAHTDGTHCVACAEGTYQPQFGNTTCLTCAAGQYTVAGGASCAACEPGKFKGAADSECKVCAAGTYAAWSGSASCDHCPNGHYQSNADFSTCLACAPGKWSLKSVPASIKECKTCGKGKYSAGGSSSCTRCASGEYQDQPAQGACLPCDAGKYQEFPGREGCDVCTAGHYSKGSASHCSACTAGRFSKTSMASGCQECDYGEFQAGEGGQSCTAHTQCAGGTYLKIVGSDRMHAGTCTECAPHTYKVGKGHWFSECQACKACEPGTYSHDCGPQRSGSCRACDSGKFKIKGTEGKGSDTCEKCHLGKYETGTGAKACLICGTGHYADALGTTECKKCPKGRFGNDAYVPYDQQIPIRATSSYCSLCEQGQYQAERGKSKCVACAKGRYGNSGRLPDTVGHCLDCEAGTFSNTTGVKACTTCDNWSPTCVHCKWTFGKKGQQACNDKPVPCDVSAWDNWQKCSKSCAGGVQTRSRTVSQPKAFGGADCPALTETRTCQPQNCPVNCLVSPWDDFGQCSEICAGGKHPHGGIKKRYRHVTRTAKFGGASCMELEESTPCNTHTCGLCSHITCHAVSVVRSGFHDGTGKCLPGKCTVHDTNKLHIEVLYHNAEARGDVHKCGWNARAKKCECQCAMKNAPKEKNSHWGAAKDEVQSFFEQLENLQFARATRGTLTLDDPNAPEAASSML
jgi:hypothetical protein